MPGPSHNQESLTEALKVLTYRSALNDTTVTPADLDVNVADRALAYYAPPYEEELEPGRIGVTVQERRPGGNRLDYVYDEDVTWELYDAVFNRAKWFTRMYVTPGDRDHVLFFFESTCRYAVKPQEVRIPGVIRGPDAVEDRLPDHIDPVVNEDTYLVPVHQIPDRYWERVKNCHDCTIPLHHLRGKPWFPRDEPDSTGYRCPECDTETDGLAGGLNGAWFIHDNRSGGEPRRNRCGPLPTRERYKYMDWLLDVEPGATMNIPGGFPTEPTTLSDGTTVDWISPIEPVTDLTEEFIQGVRPFITVCPPDHDTPFVLYQRDVSRLSKALQQQADSETIEDPDTTSEPTVE